MIYLLLLRFDDVHYGMIHSPVVRQCTVMYNFRHDDVFIVKDDDGGIMVPFAIVSFILEMHKLLGNLIERDFHGSIN